MSLDDDGASRGVPPRILLVSQPTSAGTARHVGDLAEGLLRRGARVTVASPAEGALPARLKAAGVPVVELAMQREISPLADIASYVQLVRLCRRLKPDVLHVHSSKAGFLGRMAGHVAGVPVVVFTPHSWSFQGTQGRKRDLYIALERIASWFCDMTIAVSEREAQEAIESRVVSAGRIRTIPNGLPEAEFGLPARGRRDIPFLSIGRLDEQKGYSYLLEAMVELSHKEPGVRLYIVGDGSLRGELEAQARSLGLQNVVHFEGEQTDVRSYLDRAHVFVLSSLWEGLPYTIIEAMAAHLPVVSTDVGGCSELVSDGETGRLVPAADSSALAVAMRGLWRDDVLAEKMGNAGFLRARSRFQLESCVQRNSATYDECLAGKRAVRAEKRAGSLFGPKTTTALVVVSLVVAAVVLASQLSIANRMLPGVRVGGSEVGGLTLERSATAIDSVSSGPVSVSVTPTSTALPLSGVQVQLDTMPALDRAYLVGRVGALPRRLSERIAASRSQIQVPVSAFNQGSVTEILAASRLQLDRAPKDAGFELDGTGLKVVPEQPGVRVDEAAFLTSLGAAATSPRAEDRAVRVPVRLTPAAVTRAEAKRLYSQAVEWTSRDLVASAGGARFSVPRAQVASLLAVHDGKLVVSADRTGVVLERFRVPVSAPRDARLVVVGRNVRIVDGAAGAQVDATATAQALQGAVSSGQDRFNIALTRREPNITGADLANLGINRRLSSYTTRFKLGQDGRDTNISLAASAVRGKVLGIGEVFSLNAETGPRNRSTGYKESLIFSNGKVVPGVGGGVCQVSSTTYQAALRANLRIVDRQSHSMAVSYIEPGLDATTFYPIVDLKFQNSRSGPILMWTEIRGNALTVSVFGSGAKPHIGVSTVRKKTIPEKTRIVYDAKLPPGVRVAETAGSPGYIVASFRLTYDSGRVVKREPLAIDEYRPRDRVIRVGN